VVKKAVLRPALQGNDKDKHQRQKRKNVIPICSSWLRTWNNIIRRLALPL